MLPSCCWVDFHLGRNVPVAESSKTRTGCCSIIQGCCVLSTMPCPRFDFTPCVEHPGMMGLTFICGSWNDGFSSCFIYVIPQPGVLAVFPSPDFMCGASNFIFNLDNLSPHFYSRSIKRHSC